MSQKILLAIMFFLIVMSSTSTLTGAPKKKGQGIKKAVQANIGYRYNVCNDNSILIFAKEPLTSTSSGGRIDYPATTILRIFKGEIIVIPPDSLSKVLSQYTSSENTMAIITKFLNSGYGLPREGNNLVLVRDCRNPMPIRTFTYLFAFGESQEKIDLENGVILSPTFCLSK
jgi:hypothetical protein